MKVILLLSFSVSCVWMYVYLQNAAMLFLFTVTVQGMCAIQHILLVCLHAHQVFLCCIHPANSFVGWKMLSFKPSCGILLPIFPKLQDCHTMCAVGNCHLQEDYSNPVSLLISVLIQTSYKLICAWKYRRKLWYEKLWHNCHLLCMYAD